MDVSVLSSPPLLAFVSGLAWAVIAAISHWLGQAEPLQQYYVGYFVSVIVGALPLYLINNTGLSMVNCLIGFFGAFAVWKLFDRLLSSETNHGSAV